MITAMLLAVLGGLETVDPQIAQQILEDTRLVEHHKLITEHYSIQCPLPSFNDLKAEVKCVGSGDFASCFFTFAVLCNGQPQDLTIKAERTQLGPILDLNITVNFRS